MIQTISFLDSNLEVREKQYPCRPLPFPKTNENVIVQGLSIWLQKYRIRESG